MSYKPKPNGQKSLKSIGVKKWEKFINKPLS